jgi:hypothetical protein
MHELQQTMTELAELQKQTERQLAETGRQIADTARAGDRTWQFVREVGRQIGALGEKFGSFTEGMALPSMQKLLFERFRMTVVAPRLRIRRGDRSLELDVLAYSHEIDEVYIVEVKSHLREDGLKQMLRILRDFRTFFPEHHAKKVFGILAAVDVPDTVAEKVLRAGIYLAKIHDEEFELRVPGDFQPRAW